MNKKNTKKTEEAPKSTGKGKLGSLLGHSVISVMRTCGKHGWTYEDLKAAMAAQVGKNGLATMPKEHTMRLAIKRGKDAAAGVDTGRKFAPIGRKELEALRVTPKQKKGGKAKAKKQAEVAKDTGFQGEGTTTEEAAAEVQAAA